MRSIRVRLFLILSFLFVGVVTLNLVSYFHFLELRNKREQISLGNQISMKLSALGENPFTQDSESVLVFETTLTNLKNLAERLQPPVRETAVKEMIREFEQKKKSTFSQHKKTFFTNEAEYQRYALNRMDYLEQRVLFLSGLSGMIFLFGFFLVHTFLKQVVVRPIQDLSSRMMDFLHNRFTYKFDSPKNNEIGDLHSTFNSLAQRVITHTEELKSLDQAKSDFLSIASHELRTPLTSIKGSLSLLRGGMGGSLNEVTTELLGIAEAESDRLIRLINDLLDLAKIEAQKLPLVTAWMPVDEIVQTTFNGLKGLSQSAEVELVYENPNPHLQVLVDKDRIQQVLTNLLSNAVKFSPRGDRVVTRIILNEAEGITFEVSDHGKGIDPQDQQLIFQKFRQASGPNNPIVKGTGLGLAIAKALVEEHEGRIGLRSKPGEGSTFYFFLSKWRFQKASSVAEAS